MLREREIVKMILIHCMDTEKNLRIFEVKDGSPNLVKIALEKKGFKILSIGDCENGWIARNKRLFQ
jgi:hypothetical protein